MQIRLGALCDAGLEPNGVRRAARVDDHAVDRDTAEHAGPALDVRRAAEVTQVAKGTRDVEDGVGVDQGGATLGEVRDVRIAGRPESLFFYVHVKSRSPGTVDVLHRDPAHARQVDAGRLRVEVDDTRLRDAEGERDGHRRLLQIGRAGDGALLERRVQIDRRNRHARDGARFDVSEEMDPWHPIWDR